MNLVTLRVKGPDEALDGLIRRLKLKVDSRMKKGETSRSGRPIRVSGISATLADNATPTEIEAAIEEFLALVRKAEVIFSKSELSAEIAVGLMVGSDRQFVAGVGFSPGTLRTVADLGLAIDVTAYPWCDEEGDTESDT